MCLFISLVSRSNRVVLVAFSVPFRTVKTAGSSICTVQLFIYSIKPKPEKSIQEYKLLIINYTLPRGEIDLKKKSIHIIFIIAIYPFFFLRTPM